MFWCCAFRDACVSITLKNSMPTRHYHSMLYEDIFCMFTGWCGSCCIRTLLSTVKGFFQVLTVTAWIHTSAVPRQQVHHYLVYSPSRCCRLDCNNVACSESWFFACTSGGKPWKRKLVLSNLPKCYHWKGTTSEEHATNLPVFAALHAPTSLTGKHLVLAWHISFCFLSETGW